MTQENNEQETTPKPITTCNCKHTNGLYSLSLDVEDRHVSLSADSFKPHDMGYGVTLTIFDLSPPDMIALAHAILKEGFALQPEWDKAQAKLKKQQEEKEQAREAARASSQ